MECSIHVVIKKSDEIVFESSKTASEMKEKNIPQKELQTDSEPLPMLKEGPLYHLTTAIDEMKVEVNEFISSRLEEDKETKSKRQKVAEDDEE